MPELPEVETTKRGLSPAIVGKKLINAEIFNPNLRWKIPDFLPQMIVGRTIATINRRAKYLLFEFDHGAMMIHLGMSGSLRVSSQKSTKKKHDHVIFSLEGGIFLHYHDPRRFGSILWLDRALSGELMDHPLLSNLGPEPLEKGFTGKHLYEQSRGKNTPIKLFLMNNAIVVGIGNIYANESLFLSGIHPKRAAGRISLSRYDELAKQAKYVLRKAINQGGTTLRDFVNGTGEPGYFAQSLHVYDRADKACTTCSAPIRKITLGQRASYYCPTCQR